VDKGGIDANELEAAMLSLGLRPSKEEVREIIAEIDKNKDGKIDFNGTFHHPITPLPPHPEQVVADFSFVFPRH
jgi:hypothetical protein